jgi:hypothetical protein
VARHPAPAPGKDIAVGKRVGDWVYELFMTTLAADGFLVEDVLDLYQGRGAEDRGAGRGRCRSRSRSLVLLHRVRARTVANRLSMGVEPAPLAGPCECREASSARSSGHHRKKLLPLSWLRKTRRKSMATGLGPQVGDERLVVLQPMPSCYKRMGRCALQREPASTSREVRQENAFTQRAVYVAYQTDCLRCSLREQCLAPGAKGNRARRKSRRPSSLAPTFVC